MGIDFKVYVKKAKAFWNEQNKKKKIIFISATGVVLLSIFLAIVMASNPSGKVVLYSNLGVSEGAKVVGALQNSGIDAELGNQGEVIVSKNLAPKAVMKLSEEGYDKLPDDYSIFEKGNSLLSSDSEKKQYASYQLRKDITDAIKTIEGVKDAKVIIAESDDNSFVLNEDKVESSASVKLTLSGLVPRIDNKHVIGIKHLVASSVPGLSDENVVVIDNYGNLLSSDTDTSEQKNQNSDILEFEKKKNAYLEKKILNVLEPFWGVGNVKVAVNTKLNYDDASVKETIYTPVIGDDKGILSHKDEITIQNGSPNAPINSVESNVANAEANAEVSDYPEGANNNNNNNNENVSKHDLSEDYLINKKELQTVKNIPNVETVSVYVTINRETLTEQQKSEMRAGIAAASGTTEDKVVLNNMKFSDIGELNDSMSLSDFLKTPLGIIIAVLAGTLLAVTAFFIVYGIKNSKKSKKLSDDLKRQEEQLAKLINPMNNVKFEQDNKSEIDAINESIKLGDEQINDGIQTEQSNSILGLGKNLETKLEEENTMNNILNFVDENSEIASQFIKTWIRNEDSREND